LRISNALMRYYLRIEPDELTDEEWAARLMELAYVRKLEEKREY